MVISVFEINFFPEMAFQGPRMSSIQAQSASFVASGRKLITVTWMYLTTSSRFESNSEVMFGLETLDNPKNCFYMLKYTVIGDLMRTRTICLVKSEVVAEGSSFVPPEGPLWTARTF